MSFVQLFSTHMSSLDFVLEFCHGIAKGGDCKVEFNQPSYWLYSVSNLLVFLAINNPVFRWESCKGSELESVKKCSRLCKEAGTRDWISRVARGCKPPNVEHVPSMLEIKASCQLEHYRTKSTDWPFNYLVVGTRNLVKPRVQAASELYFEKPDSSINTPYTHEM